jgi:hypothetical protein
MTTYIIFSYSIYTLVIIYTINKRLLIYTLVIQNILTTYIYLIN